MSDIVKVKWSLSVGLVGCTKTDVEEFEREDWENMDESEREDVMRDIVLQEVEWDYRAEEKTQ